MKRIPLNISDTLYADLLKVQAELDHITTAETIRRALHLYIVLNGRRKEGKRTTSLNLEML